MALSGATIPGQSEPWTSGNEELRYILQSWAEASSSDGLVLYPEHSLGESYPSAKIQSASSTAEWALLQQILLSLSFLVLLRYSFFYSFICLFNAVLFSNIC